MWHRKIAQIMAACALLACSAAAAGTPKEVLTFYYGWYGNPQTSGKWWHWKDVEEAKKTIGGSTNYPRLGAYDNHDPKTVEQHCKWAKDAGITGFIVTWWVQKDFHDQGMPLILDTAGKHGLKVTVYYETVPPRDAPKPDGAVDDVLYILERYGKHPAWLKVDGKPVIFVYGRAVGQIKLDGWRQVAAAVKEKHPAVLIGDQITEAAAEVFDGIHTYNPTGRVAGKTAAEIREWAATNFPAWVKTAGSKIACVTIIPGYDDHKLGRKEPRPITARHKGDTYRAMWEQAMAANPDWVLVTSFNEWHEGSEIEPSVEDGDLYLKLTRQYAPKFRKQKPRASGSSPSK